jgi:drug/metabolite transporter (DMT)-like permease
MRLCVSAGLQALIVSLQPILVEILAPRLVHVRVSLMQWLGLGLGILGAAIVIANRRPSTHESCNQAVDIYAVSTVNREPANREPEQ